MLEDLDMARAVHRLQREDARVLAFGLVAGYQNLVTELHGQPGQYATSLLQMAKVPEEKKQDALDKLKALSDAYSSIPEFADKAADLLLQLQ